MRYNSVTYTLESEVDWVYSRLVGSDRIWVGFC